MAEVDAEDALVRIHQRQRVELKPGDAGKRSQHSEQAALLAAHGRGNTECQAVLSVRERDLLSSMTGVTGRFVQNCSVFGSNVVRAHCRYDSVKMLCCQGN